MRTQRVILVTGAAGVMGSSSVERFLAKMPGRKPSSTCVRLISQTKRIATSFPASRARKLAAWTSDQLRGFLPDPIFYEMPLGDWNKVIGLTRPTCFSKKKQGDTAPHDGSRLESDRQYRSGLDVRKRVADQDHYVAAEAGVLGLPRCLARMFGKDGITVNVAPPGVTATPKVVKEIMPAKIFETQIEISWRTRPQTSLARFYFSASSDADFMSGQTLNVDGGRHLLQL